MAARMQAIITIMTTGITIMIRIASTALVLSALALSAPAHAQTIGDCDWRASAWALVEPWEENTRTFANGTVRVAVTDVLEPAAAAYHLVILSPPYEEYIGGRQCRTVSADGSLGFSGLTLSGIGSSYDPATGLTLTMDTQAYDPDTASSAEPRTLTVTINQATGEITANLQGGK